MAEPETKPSLYVGMLMGPTAYYRDAGIPFHVDVRDHLAELGFAEESTTVVEATYPKIPPFPAERGPTASVELSDVAVGVGIYLAGALGNGVVDQVVGDAYGRAIKPALSRSWKRLTRHRQRAIVVVFDHWYDETGVLVRVEFTSRAPDDEVPDLARVLEACDLAAAHVEEHGVTHRVMAYRVVDGRLDPAPRLAEPVR